MFKTSPKAASAWPEIPKFDPEPSIKAGLEILNELGLPFAMAGRLAVWAYVPPRRQRFTRDVDFMVPRAADQAAEIAERMGLKTRDLIVLGQKFGKAVDGGDICIDFLDSPEYYQLFSDAVGVANREAKSNARYPIISVEYLIMMKVAANRDTDSEDVMDLLPLISGEDYDVLRSLINYYLKNKVGDLDILARMIGHPGPGPTWNVDDYQV